MTTYRLKAGYEWNPLKRYRNLPCPCQSGRKVKRCHGLVDAVPSAQADALRVYLRTLEAYGLERAKRESLV